MFVSLSVCVFHGRPFNLEDTQLSIHLPLHVLVGPIAYSPLPFWHNSCLQGGKSIAGRENQYL